MKPRLSAKDGYVSFSPLPPDRFRTLKVLCWMWGMRLLFVGLVLAVLLITVLLMAVGTWLVGSVT